MHGRTGLILARASEAYALLMMQCLLSDMQPGLLKSHIEPLKARLRALIESGRHSAHEVESLVRLLNVATRTVSDKHFEVVAAALLGFRKLPFEADPSLWVSFADGGAAELVKAMLSRAPDARPTAVQALRAATKLAASAARN